MPYDKTPSYLAGAGLLAIGVLVLLLKYQPFLEKRFGLLKQMSPMTVSNIAWMPIMGGFVLITSTAWL